MVKYLFLLLLFAGLITAQTATLLTHEFNGSNTIAPAQTNFRTVDTFTFVNPFLTQTEFYIYSSMTAYAQGILIAEFEVYDKTNSLSLGSTTRSMGADSFGSLMITSNTITLTGNETRQISIRHRKITSTPNSLTTSNITSVIIALRDLNTNNTIPHLDFNITNTSNTSDFAVIGYRNFTQSTDGYIYVDISSTVLNSSTSNNVEYFIQINEFNCTTIKREVNGFGSTGTACINPTLTSAGTNNNITIFAKSSPQITTLTISNGVVYTYPTDDFLQADFNGLFINTTDFTQIANGSVNVIANQSIEASVYLSVNSTNTSTLRFFIRLFNESGSIVKDSLISTNSLSPANARVSLVKIVFENLTTQNYTMGLYASSSNDSIHLVGGSGVAVLGKSSPVQNIPTTVEILYPANGSIFGPSQCSIDLETKVESSTTIPANSIVCSFFSWTGNIDDSYVYIENRTTSATYSNFTFNITPSTSQHFRFVCGSTILLEVEDAQVDFQVIGQSLCIINASSNQSYTYAVLFDNQVYSDALGILNIFVGLWLAIMIILKPKLD